MLPTASTSSCLCPLLVVLCLLFPGGLLLLCHSSAVLAVLMVFFFVWFSSTMWSPKLVGSRLSKRIWPSLIFGFWEWELILYLVLIKHCPQLCIYSSFICILLFLLRSHILHTIFFHPILLMPMFHMHIVLLVKWALYIVLFSFFLDSNFDLNNGTSEK